MENRKQILILKSFDDDFERYFAKNMQRRDVYVVDPFKKYHFIITKILSKLIKHLNINFLTGFILNDWSKNIEEYDCIIVFDRCLKQSLVKWLSANYKERIVIWYWNIPNRLIKKDSSYDLAIFDYYYALAHDIKFVHQFYFFNAPVLANYSNKLKYDISYVGNDKNRFDFLQELSDQLDELGFTYYFYLYKKNVNNESLKDGKFLRTNISLSYNQVIKIEEDSNAVLELNLKNQSGLTLRSLECLFLNKKLITNNESIMEYDFYNKNNIFILKENNIKELLEFMKKNISQFLIKLRNHIHMRTGLIRL